MEPSFGHPPFLPDSGFFATEDLSDFIHSEATKEM